MIKGILFDKDGTLMELPAYWMPTVRKAAEKALLLCGGEDLPLLLETAGFRPDGTVIPESPVVSGTNLDIARKWQTVLEKTGCLCPADFAQRVRGFLSETEAGGRVQGTVRNLPGFLRMLQKQNIRLGIATSDDSAQTLHCLKRLQAEALFELIFTADGVDWPKPHPEILERASAAWDIPVQQLAVAGDSENDMRFAANGGATGIYFCREKREKLPTGAAVQVRDLWEILDFLKRESLPEKNFSERTR